MGDPDSFSTFSGGINVALLADPQRQNPYAYGVSNPYRFIDEDGRFSLEALPAGTTSDAGASYRINFRLAPKGSGKLIPLPSKIKKIRSVASVANAKIKEKLFGKEVTYTRVGTGVKQLLNEAETDSIFEGKRTSQQRQKNSEGQLTESEVTTILKGFKADRGGAYQKMNYPDPEEMVGRAKKNFKNSFVGERRLKYQKKRYEIP